MTSANQASLLRGVKVGVEQEMQIGYLNKGH